MQSHPPFDVPGFSAPEQIALGRASVVLRATRLADGLPVVMKQPRAGHDQLSEAVRLYHEYEMLRLFDDPGIIRTLGLETVGGVPALILEDFCGLGLDAYLRTHRTDNAEVLRIAMQVSAALGRIHACRIVHKDINPSNLLILPSTGQVKVCDFGIASQIPREVATATKSLVLEGTLEYMAPEQTGRVNRLIDYRADFYALGITMYQLLIGWLPFQSSDPLELIHAHVARAPVAPSDLNPAIPKAVSDIVMKLLAKNADERYQTAFGIQSDLAECLHLLEETGRIDGFTPGVHDRSDRFQLPQKLYGREEAIRSLHEAFDRACRERPVLLVVKGPAGIGKSALVRELEEPILRRRGLFVTGKFDQVSHDSPFAPFAHAFREIIDHLLSLSDAELQRVRDALRDSLGTLAGVLCAAIPETAVILGEQPALEASPRAESENRFKSAILRFLRTIASRDRPLVVFIDDVQWADSGSAALVRFLVSDEQVEGFMVIAALRPDEMSPGHPMLETFEDLAGRGVPVPTITLAELGAEDILSMVTETLRSDPEDAAALASMVAAKTDGNPYFLLEFLKSLYDERLLRLDGETHRWVWDIDEIQKRGITDNVVTLVAAKIDKLPDNAKKGLHVAACIGNNFDLHTFSAVTGQSALQGADALWPAVQEGLIFPLGDAYKFVGDRREQGVDDADASAWMHQNIEFRFSHDRVQQAAYLREPADERAAIHHAIARALLSGGIDAKRGQQLFDIAAQYSLGSELIATDEERCHVMTLELLAGQRAKSSSAYAAAFKYVEQGVALLRNEDWGSRYHLCRDLTLEKGECLYLLGRFDEAEKLFDDCLVRFPDVADRVRVYGLKIDQASHVGDIEKALTTAIAALAELRVRIARRPSRLTLLKEMVLARIRLRARPIDELIHLPPMTAERPRLAINLLMRVFGIAYSESQEFSALVVSKMLNLTLRYGNADVSAYAYGIYGLLLRAGFGAYRSAYQLGLLGVRLSERVNNSILRGRCNFVMGTLHNHWVHHARSNAEFITLSHRLCFENGDLLYASYALTQQVMNLQVTGAPLQQVEEQAQSSLEFVRGFHVDDIEPYFTVPLQFIRNLKGTTVSASSFDDPQFNETSYRSVLDASRYTPPRMYFRFLKMQALCLRGFFEEALAVVDESERYRHALIGQVAEWEFAYYHALALARAGKHTSGRTTTLRRLERVLGRWAEQTPANLSCRHSLVRAEIARREGHADLAITLYDAAIRAAREEGFTQVEALANEYAGRFHLERGRQRIAADYLRSAVEGFAHWGATAKGRELAREFAALLPVAPDTGPSGSVTGSLQSLTGATVQSLDLLSVLKASQALSSEIVLPRLLDRMLSIVAENAGAGRVVFIAERRSSLVIEAEHDVGAGRSRVQLAEPLEHSPLVCEAIVRYVVRTRQDVVIHDAAHDTRFAPDPYLSTRRPRSILCMAVVQQGAVTGILYLENNLIEGAFTPDRVEVLRLLSAQIAVSMENARLHEQGREYARMQEEFRLAASIQRELLPKSAPHIAGYSLCGRNIPALAVGGDYFDFLRVDDAHLAVCIGDVSGKGLPASLLMANLQATLRGQTLLHASPSECLRRANHLLHASTSPEKYATLFYAMLDLSRNRLCYCNAGHEHPLLVHPDGTGVELEKGGIGLGILEDFPFEEESIDFGRGELLLMYTDGITEAMDGQGQMFGKERLLSLVLQSRNHSAQAAVDEIIAAVAAHRKDSPQSDDITLVAVERSSV